MRATRSTSDLAAASDLTSRSLRLARAQLDVALGSDVTSGDVTSAPDVTPLVVVVSLRGRRNAASFAGRAVASLVLSSHTTARMGTRGNSAAIRDREVST
jgi:hypothetical protein